jgi:hypothetical protein
MIDYYTYDAGAVQEEVRKEFLERISSVKYEPDASIEDGVLIDGSTYSLVFNASNFGVFLDALGIEWAAGETPADALRRLGVIVRVA